MEQQPILTHEEQDQLITALYNAARCIAPIWVAKDRRDDLVQDFTLQCIEELRENRWEWPSLSLDRFVEVALIDRKWRGRRSRARLAARDAEHLRVMEQAEREWMAPELGAEEKRNRALILKIRRRLSAKQRKIHVMLREEHRSYREVAAKVGISVAAVHETVKVVHQRFRAELIARGIEVPAPVRASGRNHPDKSEQSRAIPNVRGDHHSFSPSKVRRLAS